MRMKALVRLLLIMLLLSTANCRRANPTASILGSYDLIGYNSSGQRVFTGIVSLTSQAQNLIEGQCTLVREKDAGPAIVDQQPHCQAELKGKKITVDFGPYLDDGGMIFEGEIVGDRISGVWMFETFAGNQPGGKFEAVKK